MPSIGLPQSLTLSLPENRALPGAQYTLKARPTRTPTDSPSTSPEDLVESLSKYDKDARTYGRDLSLPVPKQ